MTLEGQIVDGVLATLLPDLFIPAGGGGGGGEEEEGVEGGEGGGWGGGDSHCLTAALRDERL